jgi:zinc D-Ala-D-Ala carboxypeptidase
MTQRGSSRSRPPGRKRPNYTLRRIMALLVAILAFALVSRLVSAVVSLFDSGDRTALSQGGPSSAPTTRPPPIPPPDCALGQKLAPFRSYDEWQLTLLDTNYRLPKAYAPPGLQPISKAGFKGSLLIRKELIEDLAALREAADANGTPIDVVAAYRSYGEQASLFERRKDQLGSQQAQDKTARAGHSEHQLGTAVDFKTSGQRDVTAKWDQTPTGRWIVENAWRFGFVQSYPKEREAITCYGTEPWHYRYFGRTLAAELHGSGLTVREFLWNEQHRSASPIP